MVFPFFLLGDKMETARNIAHSCRLFEAGMEVIPLVAKSAEALREILTHELNRLIGWTSPETSPCRKGGKPFPGRNFCVCPTYMHTHTHTRTHAHTHTHTQCMCALRIFLKKFSYFIGLPFLAESSTNLHEPSINSTAFFKHYKGDNSRNVCI